MCFGKIAWLATRRQLVPLPFLDGNTETSVSETESLVSCSHYWPGPSLSPTRLLQPSAA